MVMVDHTFTTDERFPPPAERALTAVKTTMARHVVSAVPPALYFENVSEGTFTGEGARNCFARSGVQFLCLSPLYLAVSIAYKPK
jgi:hypothetical protein